MWCKKLVWGLRGRTGCRTLRGGPLPSRLPSTPAQPEPVGADEDRRDHGEQENEQQAAAAAAVEAEVEAEADAVADAGANAAAAVAANEAVGARVIGNWTGGSVSIAPAI